MITVLVVDDHTLVRMGIIRLLGDFKDIEVIGEAENGEKALSMIKIKAPDVVLLDMKMPGLDGWEVTRRLHKTNPDVKIIVVTALNNEPLPARVLQLGAVGYLTKESGAQEMADAIRAVYKGEKYLSSKIAQQIAMESLLPKNGSPFNVLSEREMQLMVMITSGMKVSEIAAQLFLSTKTVHGYRYKIFEKLSVKNDVELTYLAIQHKVIEKNPVDLDG